jgi:hypothetical protein
MPSVMVGQIDRIANLIDLPTVRLGVIPVDVRLPVVSLYGHLMLDDEIDWWLFDATAPLPICG